MICFAALAAGSIDKRPSPTANASPSTAVERRRMNVMAASSLRRWLNASRNRNLGPAHDRRRTDSTSAGHDVSIPFGMHGRDAQRLTLLSVRLEKYTLFW